MSWCHTTEPVNWDEVISRLNQVIVWWEMEMGLLYLTAIKYVKYDITIVFQENKSYQTCQVLKTWQVLKPKYLSEHLYSHKSNGKSRQT